MGRRKRLGIVVRLKNKPDMYIFKYNSMSYAVHVSLEKVNNDLPILAKQTTSYAKRC